MIIMMVHKFQLKCGNITIVNKVHEKKSIVNERTFYINTHINNLITKFT